MTLRAVLPPPVEVCLRTATTLNEAFEESFGDDAESVAPDVFRHLLEVETAAREMLEDYGKVMHRMGLKSTDVHQRLETAILDLDSARTR